jgi:hypothetical protein
MFDKSCNNVCGFLSWLHHTQWLLLLLQAYQDCHPLPTHEATLKSLNTRTSHIHTKLQATTKTKNWKWRKLTNTYLKFYFYYQILAHLRKCLDYGRRHLRSMRRCQISISGYRRNSTFNMNSNVYNKKIL